MRPSLKLVVVLSTLVTAGALVSESIMFRRLAQSRPGVLSPITRFRHQRFYKAVPNAENEGLLAFRAAVDSLCAPVGSLKGVGKITSEELGTGAGVSTVGELLFRLPSSVIDRSQLSTVPAAVESLREMMASSSAIPGEDPPPSMIATFVLTPLQYVEPLPDSAQPYKVACVDGSGSKIDLVFFRKSAEGWRKVMESLPLGGPKIVSGRVQAAFGNQDLAQSGNEGSSERNGGGGSSVPSVRAQLQVLPVDSVSPLEDRARVLKCEPRYSPVNGLTPAKLHAAHASAVASLGQHCTLLSSSTETTTSTSKDALVNGELLVAGEAAAGNTVLSERAAAAELLDWAPRALVASRNWPSTFWEALALAHAPTSAAELPPLTAAAAARGISMDSFPSSASESLSSGSNQNGASAADKMATTAENKAAVESVQFMLGGAARERLAFDEMVTAALLHRLKALRDSTPGSSSGSEEEIGSSSSLGDDSVGNQIDSGQSKGNGDELAPLVTAMHRGLLRLSPMHAQSELLAALGPAAVQAADSMAAVLMQYPVDRETSLTAAAAAAGAADDADPFLNLDDDRKQVESALGLLRVLGPHLHQGSPSEVSASLAAHQKQVRAAALGAIPLGESWAQSYGIEDNSLSFMDSLPPVVAALMRAQAQGSMASKKFSTKKRKKASKVETVAVVQDSRVVAAVAAKDDELLTMGAGMATSSKLEIAIVENDDRKSISEEFSETAVAMEVDTTMMSEGTLLGEDQTSPLLTVKGDRPELEPYGFVWRSRRLKQEEPPQKSLLEDAAIEPVRFAPIASSATSTTGIAAAASQQTVRESTDSKVGTITASEVVAAAEAGGTGVAAVNSLEEALPRSVGAAARPPSSSSSSPTSVPPVGREGYLWSLLRGQMGQSTSHQEVEENDTTVPLSASSTTAPTHGAADSAATTSDNGSDTTLFSTAGSNHDISKNGISSAASTANAALKLSKFRPKWPGAVDLRRQLGDGYSDTGSYSYSGAGGGDWGVPLMVVLDVEATGLDVENDRVIQIAARVLDVSLLAERNYLTSENDNNHDLTNHDAPVPEGHGTVPNGGSSFSRYVDPGQSVSSLITELTGIDDGLLSTHSAKPFPEAWNEFDSWLNQQRRCTSMALHDDLEPQSLSSSQSSSSSTALTVGLARPCVLFAHNAPYDINILSHEVRRANVAKNAFGAEPGALPSLRAAGFASSVDTIHLCRALWKRPTPAEVRRRQDLGLLQPLPLPPPRFGLGALHKHLIGEDLAGAHTAVGDVDGLLSVLAKLEHHRWSSLASDIQAPLA